MILQQLRSARQIGLACAGLFLLFAGCAPAATPVPVPTLPLSPVAFTPTPTPVPPSPSPGLLPGPADLRATATIPALQPLFEVDPDIDERLLLREIDALAASLDIEPALIQLVDAQRATWRRAPLRCQVREIARSTIEGVLTRLLVGDAVHTYFSRDGVNFIACAGTERARDELLLAVDPVAAELLLLAQQRVAQELDLPLRRVQMVEVVPFTWEDTSLGCPLAGQTYNPATINGYRIVVSAGGQNFVFHSDSVALVACASGS